MDAVQQTLSSVGLRESRSIVGTLLIQAHRASSLGYEIDPKSVDQNVTNVIQLDQLVCKLSQTSPDPLPISSQSKIGQVTANLKLPRLIHSDTTTARMMLLLGSVSLTILTIYGLTLVYNWIYAYTHNRRLCRIQAVISQGLDVIDGHITLLDHKECHFQPVNDGALARVATLSNTSGVAL
ncbi:hypothetical protein [Shimia abyssi]|nr:hypothetical protein [Shimia abyssi]